MPTTGFFCPVKALSSFLAVRPAGEGPLFVDEFNVPVKRSHFSNFLKQCIELAGYPKHLYNTHSFRIGRTTQLAQDNTYESIIKRTGRWKSKAYHKYIRPQQFTLPQ